MAGAQNIKEIVKQTLEESNSPLLQEKEELIVDERDRPQALAKIEKPKIVKTETKPTNEGEDAEETAQGLQINEAETSAEGDQDKIPANMPKDWRDAIEAQPHLKKQILKQFKDFEKAIHGKFWEASQQRKQFEKASAEVQQYLGALTDGLQEHVAQNYKGNVAHFAADVNRMVRSLTSPYMHVRKQAMLDLVKQVFPEGVPKDNPDPLQAATLEKLERLERQLNAARQPAQQTQQQPLGQDIETQVASHLNRIFQYNPAAQRFLTDELNVQFVRDRVADLEAQNPGADIGLILRTAVLEAMEQKATESAANDAKRRSAAELSKSGSRRIAEPPPEGVLTAKEAALQAWTEIKTKGRM